MKLICTMPVRNEEWCIGLTARAVLQWCDGLVVMCHASTDHTSAILLDVVREFAGRPVVVIENPDPVWHEMAHRQNMLEMARECGATHIALVDADEILSGNLLGCIRRDIEAAPAGVTIETPWISLRNGIDKVFSSGWWARSNVSTAFADEPRVHWSSAERGGYDFHHRHPLGRPPVAYPLYQDRRGGLMHLQFVNDKRFKAKQYLYQLTERLRWPEKDVNQVREMYGYTVREANNGQTSPVPWEEWWGPYKRLLEHFNIDQEPWQLAECRKILAENPGIGKGLDDYGLPL